MSIHAHTPDDTTPSHHPDDLPHDSQAARLLAMTARETDQWRAEARIEADAVVSEAREEAARLVRAAKAEVEGVASKAREEAAQIVNDARVEAYRVREQTTESRKRLDEEIATLTQQAADLKAQLRRHLTDLLDRVEATPGADS
jgi:cell division septum initiation protein DivIVA